MCKIYNFLVAEYDYDLDMKMKGEENRRVAFRKGKEEGIKEGIKEGITQGREEGKEEGEKNAKIAMAKMMKNKGFDVQVIMEMTELTQEEIDKL